MLGHNTEGESAKLPRATKVTVLIQVWFSLSVALYWTELEVQEEQIDSAA
jgi:hypothetical protein